VIVDHAPQGLDPLSQIIVFRHGGAVSRIQDTETAFSNRAANMVRFNHNIQPEGAVSPIN
jgi:hypothetical protein